MAFKFANSVRETSTTTGTGTLDLAGAVSGYQTFVAGIGSTNTCPYTIEDANGTAWECGIGTVTDAAPDTLARTTLLSSSTGSAISLSAGTHTVFCAWPAERAQQVNLEHVAGTDAAVSMAVGQMYVVDMSAWATADRTYTLPATALVGDRCGIMVSAGNASYELLVTAASGDTLNAVAGGTEWSRVFITGETLIFRCIAASATWIVERDGRIPQQGVMRLSTASTAESAGTWTIPTTKSGAWTADTNIGGICSTSNSQIIPRRLGRYNLSAAGTANSVGGFADKTGGMGIWLNAPTTTLLQNNVVVLSAAGQRWQACCSVNAFTLPSLGDYFVYTYYSEEGSLGLIASTSAGSPRCQISCVEVLP